MAETSEQAPEALTDEPYWDRVWQHTDEQSGAAPEILPDRDRPQARLAAIFARHLGPGARFCEVGAGGSAWPAYVARTYRAESWGIDFSRPGLAMTARAAARAGQTVKLVEGDLFDRARLPAHHFDVVYSGGFVEHFPDAAPLMRRLAELVRPGGVVVTAVPHLRGLNGWLQRRVDPGCFARHVAFTPHSLDAAHASGGLEAIEPAGYVGVIDLAAVNLGKTGLGAPPLLLKLWWAGVSKLRSASEWVADRLDRSDGGARLAPCLIGVYAPGPIG
ncbi:MAG TPA: methyltransferase domain-containing protein [Polyangia bacterium]